MDILMENQFSRMIIAWKVIEEMFLLDEKKFSL